MSGREESPRKVYDDNVQTRGRGHRYPVGPRAAQSTRSDTRRPSSTVHVPSRAEKRPAERQASVPLKTPPKSYMKPADGWRNVKLEDLKVKHGLQDFEVKFFGDGDDLTYDMIITYAYDSTHLLTTVGQLEAGLRLPLYRSGDSFVYDVLSSRHGVDKSARRSVIQYSGNFLRILDECRLRQRGETRLECYTPDPSERDWYTSDNFNATYKDYTSPSNRKKWSVGLARRKLTRDQQKDGVHLLLGEIDYIGLKFVPGTEKSANPIPFPKSQRLREDHDYRWHRTPIEIIGPWAWGWSLNNLGSFRRSGPERYGDYCPWLLCFDHFHAGYNVEEQYDFSEEAKQSKKLKSSRKPLERVDEDESIPDASSTQDLDDDDDYDGDDVDDDVGDFGIYEHTSGAVVQKGSGASSKVVVLEDDESDGTPPSGTAPTGSAVANPSQSFSDVDFVLENVIPIPPVVVQLAGSPKQAFEEPSSPWPEFKFSEGDIPVNLPVVETLITNTVPEQAKEAAPDAADEGQLIGSGKEPSLDSANAGVGSSGNAGMGPSMEKGKDKDPEGMDISSIDLFDTEAFYAWARSHGLIEAAAPSAQQAFLASPVVPVGQMISLVEGPALQFPQHTLASLVELSRSQQYSIELYKLEKLRSAQFASYFKSANLDLSVARHELAAAREKLLNVEATLSSERQFQDKALALEKELDQIKKEFAGMKADLDESKSKADKAIERVKQSEDRASVAEADVIKLKARAAVAEADATKLRAQVAVAEADATKLRAQVAVAGADVTKLRAQIVTQAEAHAGVVAKTKTEAVNKTRGRYLATMQSFIAMVNKDNGRNYKLEL